MKLDGNNMIALLSLPEHDERIQAMLEGYGEERPIYDPEDTTVFIKPKGLNIEMLFDDRLKTREQKELNEGGLFFNQIIVYPTSPLALPFNIQWKDDYNQIKHRIEQETEIFEHLPGDKFGIWLLSDEHKKILLTVRFFDETQEKIKDLYIELYDPDFNYPYLTYSGE